MQIRVRPTVVGFDRVRGQVVQLPLVIKRRHPIELSPKPVGRQVTHSGFGPGSWIVEGTDQLSQVRGASGSRRIVYAGNKSFEIGRGVGRDPNAQRRRRIDRMFQAARQAR